MITQPTIPTGYAKFFAQKHSRFKVIKGKALPADWLGKNYACYQLAQQATGDYYLFLDADEQVYKRTYSIALFTA
jgi:glycosyltransferase involved in cell wall biosynthesis